MIFPYTYITTWEYITHNGTTYWKNDHKSEYGNDAFPIIKTKNNSFQPTFIRVCFTGINTIHNNSGNEPFDANKEYDLNFSVYGLWNTTQIINQQNIIYGTEEDIDGEIVNVFPI